MNREQADVVVHPFIHVTVEAGERRKGFADLLLLVNRLFEQSLGNDELQVLLREQYLDKAVTNAPQTVGHKLETCTIKNGFLHTRNEAKPRVLADLANLAQE